MKTIVYEQNAIKVIEVVSDALLFGNAKDAMDLIMDLAYSSDRKLIFHKEQISPDFYELKTKIAGDIFQKLVNYHIQIAIVGNFRNETSKSLNDFIRESNKGKMAFFVDDLETAKQKLFSTHL